MSRGSTASTDVPADQRSLAAAPGSADSGAGATSGTAGSTKLRARRRRRVLGVLILVGLLVASCLLSIGFGSKTIPLGDVFGGLFAPTGSQNDLIIQGLRLPRTGAGLLAGGALGLAGALMQGHTRNPIADPGILGITQGAALAVVLSVFSFGISGIYGTVWFGFAGALLGALAVFGIGSLGRDGPTPVTLALAGAAISYLLQAITSAVVLMDQQSLDTYRFWKVGSISITEAAPLYQVLPFAVIGLVLGLANARGLNALALGEDVARSLGHHVGLARVLGVSAIAVLVGAAVALCGPISFVGLVVPHVARFFVGADYRWLLPFALFMGASLVLLADVAGRLLARPSELQVGVVLSVIGAPFFIALVRRRKLVRL